MVKLSKRLKWWLVIASGLVLAIATVPLAIWITHQSGAQLENTQRRCEGKRQTSHVVLIRDDKLSPVHTDARQCDTLTITNLDDKLRLVAFGKHDSHVSYDGVSERVLGQGQSLTVTLGSVGSYLFHDHDQAALQGSFTVRY